MKLVSIRRLCITGVFVGLVFVLNACGVYDKSAFKGNEIADEECFNIDFEVLNMIHTHEMILTANEYIKVQITKDAGSISVLIRKDDEEPVYKGDDITTGEFQVQIKEPGTYQLCVSGKRAKGHVIFLRCGEKRRIENESK